MFCRPVAQLPRCPVKGSESHTEAFTPWIQPLYQGYP
jgi:hypothetical protein